jgi:hypothetical protein
VGRVRCSPGFGMACARGIIWRALTKSIVSRRRHHRHSAASDGQPFGRRAAQGRRRTRPSRAPYDLLRFFNRRLHATPVNAWNIFSGALISSEKSYKVGLSVLLEEPQCLRPGLATLFSCRPHLKAVAKSSAWRRRPSRDASRAPLCERSPPPARRRDTDETQH